MIAERMTDYSQAVMVRDFVEQVLCGLMFRWFESYPEHDHMAVERSDPVGYRRALRRYGGRRNSAP